MQQWAKREGKHRAAAHGWAARGRRQAATRTLRRLLSRPHVWNLSARRRQTWHAMELLLEQCRLGLEPRHVQRQRVQPVLAAGGEARQKLRRADHKVVDQRQRLPQRRRGRRALHAASRVARSSLPHSPSLPLHGRRAVQALGHCAVGRHRLPCRGQRRCAPRAGVWCCRRRPPDPVRARVRHRGGGRVPHHGAGRFGVAYGRYGPSPGGGRRVQLLQHSLASAALRPTIRRRDRRPARDRILRARGVPPFRRFRRRCRPSGGGGPQVCARMRSAPGRDA